jgi:hypothetical protein
LYMVTIYVLLANSPPLLYLSKRLGKRNAKRNSKRTYLTTDSSLILSAFKKIAKIFGAF